MNAVEIRDDKRRQGTRNLLGLLLGVLGTIMVWASLLLVAARHPGDLPTILFFSGLVIAAAGFTLGSSKKYRELGFKLTQYEKKWSELMWTPDRVLRSLPSMNLEEDERRFAKALLLETMSLTYGGIDLTRAKSDSRDPEENILLDDGFRSLMFNGMFIRLPSMMVTWSQKFRDTFFALPENQMPDEFNGAFRERVGPDGHLAHIGMED